MTARTFRVALTGGIASGKTTIANFFGEFGAVLIDTDLIARDVVAAESPGLQQVVDTFGPRVLQAEGGLDRRTLRSIVFADEKKRLLLESILHPLIREETERQMQIRCRSYQIIVVPLLLGSPLKDRVDRILVVDCSEEEQLRRLLERDNETMEQAHRMIAAQVGREERLALADDVILNEADIAASRDQVEALHNQYLLFARDNLR